MLGLTSSDFRIKIGGRHIINELLRDLDLSQEQLDTCFLTSDKKGKISDEQIISLLLDQNIPQNSVNRIFEIIKIDAIEQVEKYLGRENLILKELKEFFSLAEIAGIAD